MIPRGSSFRAVFAGALVGAVLVAGFLIPASGAATSKAERTLNLSLPGPFNGCTILDPGATPTTNAVLDLLRPSAFLTSPTGSLVGEGGAIASAELVSLKPETVVYTIAPDQFWSNGDQFDGVDLVAWWLKAKQLPSVQSDGYRDIKSLSESNDGLTITATFSSDYAEWNLLFRDVEDVGTPLGCSWKDFLARPTLGPYGLVSASAHRIVLSTNKLWTLDPNRFQRVVITDSDVIPSSPSAYFVGYTLQVNSTTVEAASMHPSVLSKIGTYSDVAEIAFAPGRPLTSSLLVREGLSWSLDRQALINQLFGSVTFSVSVASSALYSQGQSAYPGGGGNGPSAQSTTTTVGTKSPSNALADCAECAQAALKNAGYVLTSQGWRSASGVLLSIRVAVGPTPLDRAMASQIETQWKAKGVAVRPFIVGSDEAAAEATAGNYADAAIFTRPTTTTASYTARSWSGPAYPDAYSSGVESKVFNKLFKAGVQNFNPVSASVTWLDLDQDVMTGFWVRPLFTTPSLAEWSNSITTVSASISIPGLVDQEVSWLTTSQTPEGS